MPISFPPSPAPGDTYPYNGKNWRRMDGYWSASAIQAPADVSRQFYFLNAIALLENTIESALYTPQSPFVIPTTAVQITYL